MDFEERMDALQRKLDLIAQLHLDADMRHQEKLEEESRRWQEKMEQSRAESEANHRKNERDIEAMRQMLRGAIRMGVREARNQRKRSELLDSKITQLAAAQLVTEEKLQGLISALRLDGNGSGQRNQGN